MTATTVDVLTPAVYLDGPPWERFAWLRANAPVYDHPLDDPLLVDRCWVVSRHEDVRAVSRDPATFSSADGIHLRRTATHHYAAPGTYGVTLTVTDDRGATAVRSGTVTVTAPPPNAAPEARFSVSGSGLVVGARGALDPAGSTTWSVVPRSTELVAQICPPCISTSRCTIASPRPLPPVSRARALSVR